MFNHGKSSTLSNNFVEIKSFNNTFFEFFTTDTDVYQKIKKRFSYVYTYYKNRQKRIANISLIENNRYLYCGLFDDFVEFLDSQGINYYCHDVINKEFEFSMETLKKFVEDLQLSVVPHYYQMNALHNAIIKKKAIILSPTSSGKSLIMSLIAIFFRAITKDKSKKVLILVPNIGLVNQFFLEFIEYFRNNDKIDPESMIQMIHSEISSSKRDLSKPIIVSTWQSKEGIEKMFEEIYGKSFFEQVGCLIYDEAHQSQAKVSQEIVKRCVNTQFKISLTGTLFEEEEEYKNTIIKGMFGSVYTSISTKDMIRGGYACDLTIYNLLFDFGFREKMTYDEEIDFVRKDDDYLRYCIDFCATNMRDGNTIILHKSLDYGRKIQAYINNVYPSIKTFVVNGSVSGEERINIKNEVERGMGIIVIATYKTLGVGFSIKNLHYGVMIENMKRKIPVIQALGRFLRKHKSKDMAFVFDMVPVLNYWRIGNNGDNIEEDGYLYSHYLKRLNFYIQEKHNYKVRIIDNWKCSKNK